MRRIDLIVIHCTATIEGRDHDIREVAEWHRKRGFRQVGYHYLVKLDGTVQKGRDEAVAGAHVQGYNAHSIGIAYVGGLGSDAKAKDTRTVKQKAAMVKLLRELRTRYPKVPIKGHRDLSKDLNGDGIIQPREYMKMCPSFNAITEYASL